MARELTIVTPENIPITLELAGLGSRFAALAIDIVVQMTTIFIGLILFGILASVFSLAGMDKIVLAVRIGFVFVVMFGYFLLLETIWNGQTIGKRALGLRVIRDGGYPIHFFAAATRNLIRIADFVPFNYGVGALVAFLSPGYKRLGDLVAGTVVIKEREARFLRAFTIEKPQIGGLPLGPNGIADPFGKPARPKYTGPRLPDTARNPLDVLENEELALLRRFASRRWDMTADDAERLAYRLVVPLIARLNITFIANVPPRYADLASVIVGTADLTAAEREEAAGVRL